MAELRIQLGQIRENILTMDQFFYNRGLTWTLVLKVLGGYAEYLKPVLEGLVLKSMIGVADSRIDHLEELKIAMPYISTWQIRPPALQNAERIAAVVDVSCNSSITTLRELNRVAQTFSTIHQVVLMVELGENREGVLPSELPELFEEVFHMDHLRILGLGANLGCLYGVEPTYEKLSQLLAFKEAFEKKYDMTIPLISGGSSINLPLIESGQLPKTINHYRIGEAVFFGTTPYDGEVFGNLNVNNFLFYSSVLEVYKKELEPVGALVPAALGETYDKPEATIKGAQVVLDFGIVDVDSKNLSPLLPHLQIMGSTSDMTTVYDPLGKLKVGDQVVFAPDYMGVAKLMVSSTIGKSFF